MGLMVYIVEMEQNEPIITNNNQLSPLHRKYRKIATKMENRTEEIIRLKKENPALPTRAIGELTKCDHSHVVRVLNRYSIDQGETQDYKANMADILLGFQHRILRSITDEEIKKASLQVKFMGFGIAYDKYRLETNQSTGNLSVIQSTLQELKRLKTDE